MAGHSKWANIKHKKGRADAKRGKVFSRVTKEIIQAVKAGGSDPKSNAKLKLAIQKAKAVNLPADNIERNIKKAVKDDSIDYLEITYELYGHGGVGIIVDAMTDNKNRLASDMRIATNKKGGTVATPGAVTFNFDRKGVLQVNADQGDEDTLSMQFIEAGAEDFDKEDDLFIVITDAQDLYKVKENLESGGLTVQEASLEMIPKTWVECDKESFEKNEALIAFLEESDDVDIIFHNMKEIE
ncbi:YebC/PmpR family DNA-binding transcriptional regulator [Candidatus Aerophobetes bacterium]|uniref:Probable transcriptional regulatory protein COB21_04880 n=1 Tax=Aerophobetes bacterium TaxID=2030807 RepID=A0A2A4X1W4_UNCAE|nr:MAG: YebC/PmpR family DNA-binding transcriptional regulator [Candidatus Aerophobetes bacterium]